MRIAIVSYIHPDVRHVSAVRAWRFGCELAQAGHRVVQICEALPSEPDRSASGLAARVSGHDWRAPLLLSVHPVAKRSLRLVRDASTPASVRKPLILWSYLRHSGMFTDFSDALEPYLPVLAREFRPDVVWGVFGNTDSWLVAQRLARRARCPWVGDMKDSWDVCIRRGLRRVIAARFGDMAAATVNAQYSVGAMTKWFRRDPAVVYSGVDECFLHAAPPADERDVVRVTLTGSVRDPHSLERFVDALGAWLAERPAQQTPVELVYAGADAGGVRSSLLRLQSHARVIVQDYLALEDLARLCRSATANAYIWAPTGFHHKLLELLSSGRPVIAFPGETAESCELSAATGGLLRVCRSSDDVRAALDSAAAGLCSASPAASAFGEFTWSAQARRLERVFVPLTRKASAA